MGTRAHIVGAERKSSADRRPVSGLGRCLGEVKLLLGAASCIVEVGVPFPIHAFVLAQLVYSHALAAS